MYYYEVIKAKSLDFNSFHLYSDMQNAFDTEVTAKTVATAATKTSSLMKIEIAGRSTRTEDD